MKSGKTYHKVSSVSCLFGIRIGTALLMTDFAKSARGISRELDFAGNCQKLYEGIF